MAIIDQLRAPGADVPALLAANKAALTTGLADLESADPAVTEWRDALLSALAAGDMTRRGGADRAPWPRTRSS